MPLNDEKKKWKFKRHIYYIEKVRSYQCTHYFDILSGEINDKNVGGWDSLWRRWRGGKSNVAMVTKNKQNIFIKVLVQCMPSLNKIGEHVFSGSLPRKVQTRLNLVFLCSWTKFQLHQNFDFSTIKKNNQLICILAKSVYIMPLHSMCAHVSW